MNKEKVAEYIGKIDDKYLEEVLEHKRKKRRIHMNSLKIIATAACAALVIGAGVFALGSQTELPAEPTKDPQPGTEMNLPVLTEHVTDSDSVEVERSYNERIADGEDVSIETYIGQEFIVDDYSFVLRDVLITQTFPEGITKDDLWDSAGSVIDYNGYDIMAEDYEKGYPYDEHRRLDVLDCIDDEGRYNGPSKEGYRWVFVTMDMTNLDAVEKLEYVADMSINGGMYVENFVERWIDADGSEHSAVLDYGFYAYDQYPCYLSEHTDLELYDGMAEIKKFHNLHFDPNESKTLVIGYAISDHFVFGDIRIQLHLDTASSPADFVYVPLK